MTKIWDSIHPDSVRLLEAGVRAAFEKQAERLIIYNLAGQGAFSDYIVVCQGRSDRQVRAIEEAILAVAGELDEKPMGVEGGQLRHWVLIDFATVVFNIFYEPVRDYYDLDSLWSDAETIDSEALIREGSQILGKPLPMFLKPETEDDAETETP